MNSIVTQDALRMRPRQDPQRSIVGSGVVEMNSKCQDLAKHTRRGVRIYHAVLDRPRSPTRGVVAIPKGHGGILMPHHKPVGLGRLVKQRARKGNASAPRTSRAMLSKRGSRARAATEGCLSAWRTPALLRLSGDWSRSSISRRVSRGRSTSGKTPKPSSSIIFSVFIGRLCPVMSGRRSHNSKPRTYGGSVDPAGRSSDVGQDAEAGKLACE